jgi:HD-like signal output (HDOD) protein
LNSLKISGKVIGGSQLLEDIKSEKLTNIIALVNESDISSIKSTVSELVRLINDPESSAKDLKKVVELDPPLSAKLLKLANSAYYGFPRTIWDLQEAVVCIGYDALKEIALNQKICQLFSQVDTFAGYSRALLWKHSVAVALCGKLIFKQGLNKSPGNIYVAGLVHDIGIIVEDQFLLGEFLNVLVEAGSGKKNISEIERAVLAFDHSDVGRVIADDWEFPPELSAAIGHHHTPDVVDDEYEIITSTLYISDFLCQGRNIGFCDAPKRDYQLFEKCRRRLNLLAKANINENDLNLIVKEVEKKIAKMEETGWF